MDVMNNEAIQTNLVTNFDEFISYISEHVVQLTKIKEYISKKHLSTINERITLKDKDCTPNPVQDYYSYIHFLYQLALSGCLLEKVSVKLGPLQLKETERMNLYKSLTAIEKYFFLLETFWVDMNWAKLQDKQHNTIATRLSEVFSALSREKPEQVWEVKNAKTNVGKMLASCTYDWHYFYLYFEWFGFWVCEEHLERKEKRGSKSAYFAKKIIVTQLGAKMMSILLVSRNICAWNIAFRREHGEFNAIPGSEIEDVFDGFLSDEDYDRVVMNVEDDQSTQPFFQPFTDLFPNDELIHTLPRNRKKFIDGSYTFKISLSKGTSRKVVLSAKHTMEDLHQIIINAFQFDDDHLYSFFMDGEKWSQDCIASPNDDFGHADASKVQIGAIGLSSKQKFLYVYDYGEEWTFIVEVDNIKEDSQQLFNPYVKETKGEAPQQYDGFY